MADNWNKDIIYMDLLDCLSHGISVSNLTYLTAKKMNLEEDICYELAIAGLLHDIGKLKLSSYLYGRMSKGMMIEEMQYMRKHPVFGYNILKQYDYSDRILEAVLYHHESCDGSGYPENRKKEEIPLGAKIIRVADTFSALISERPYRGAFDPDTAMKIIIESIEEYDMQIFLAFQKVIHDDGVLEKIQSNNLFINIDLHDLIQKDFVKEELPD